MKAPMSRSDRKSRAKRLVGPVILALGLTMTEGARRLGVEYRQLCKWRSSDPDSPSPSGKTLVRVERFLSRAQSTLKRRGQVQKDVEELLSKE